MTLSKLFLTAYGLIHSNTNGLEIRVTFGNKVLQVRYVDKSIFYSHRVIEHRVKFLWL